MYLSRSSESGSHRNGDNITSNICSYPLSREENLEWYEKLCFGSLSLVIGDFLQFHVSCNRSRNWERFLLVFVFVFVFFVFFVFLILLLLLLLLLLFFNIFLGKHLFIGDEIKQSRVICICTTETYVLKCHWQHLKSHPQF